MQLINSTDYPDYFLKRMVSWCCKQLDLPIRCVREAAFRNTAKTWGGIAYRSYRIGVRIGSADHYPTNYRMRSTGKMIGLSDRLEGLLMATAHELAHLMYMRNGNKSRRSGGNGGSEHNTDWQVQQVMQVFRSQRNELVTAWNCPLKECTAKPKLSVRQRRAATAQTYLAKWQRKLKLAKTKIRKYKQRVRYYEKKALLCGTE